MALGPGKYDSELTEVRERVGATSAVLIVLDGVRGPGFACQATPKAFAALPEMLEYIARQMRKDRTKGKSDMTEPYYTALPPADLKQLTDLVERAGYAPVIAGLADILTQDPKLGMRAAPQLSFALGAAMAAAQTADDLRGKD